MNTMKSIFIRCGWMAGVRNATNNVSRTKSLQSRVAKQTVTLLMIIMYFISSCHATEPGQLRLMGMNNGEGIVEITHRNHWGLICASRWTFFDGDVACRQLGYEGVTRVMRVTPGREDRIDVDFVLNGTNCEGTESRLVDCEHSGFGNFTESCQPMMLPWVSCIGADIPEVTDAVGGLDLDPSNHVPVLSGRILPPVATVSVETFPAISVQHVGHDSVTLSWLDWYDRLRASDPRVYRVRIIIKYRRVDLPGVESSENYTIAAEVPTYWTDHTITGLQPRTAYEFIVESVRLSMFGGEVIEPPSAPVYVRTVCGGPPPIRHLHLEAPTNNATVLHVHWTMPVDNGCSSDDYVVEYRQENVDQCEIEISPLPSRRLTVAGETGKTHLVVAGLQPYSSYTVFVSARNQFGRSMKVNATKRTSETVPSDVPINIRHNFQSQNSLKLTWDPPSCGWRGGHIVTYAYMLIDINTDSVIHRGSTRREFVVFPDVDSLQRYKFLVAASTQRGVGPFAVSDIPVEPNILHICGRAQERIARISTGMRAPRGAAPWMAQLWSVQSGRMFCAGSIINEYWIITAAHCVEAQSHSASTLKIQLGDYDRLMPETHQRAYDVAEIVVHEGFNSQVQLDHDIALIKLSERIEFNNYVRPICFPTTKLAKSYLKSGSYGSVAGWGRKGENMDYPRYLHQVFVPVVERKTCRRATSYDFTSNMFCAGFREANRGDACEGDSGAPFSKQHTNGRWYILGTVSWGDACDDQDKYGYYTRLHRYTSWIKRHTRVRTE
ncbi:uncharacterized protein LOC129256030 [Lytechinus pictus]|uniref:uncharacterized protein LOC129256030 n=1 Tax=Lytechinus pictus TaxID=7653 RepID=UPI0030B9C874